MNGPGPVRIASIVLAGGRGSRMGGIDKPAIRVGGRTLLDAALAATASYAPTIVVGPNRPELAAQVRQVREEPPLGGPVAAIAAGMTLVPAEAESVVVLAADLPFVSSTVVDSLVARRADATAVFAADTDGHPQWLIGVWRTRFLRERLAALDSPADRPMRVLLPDDVTTLELSGVGDCDTPLDVARVGAELGLDLDDARDLIRISLPRLPIRRSALAGQLGAVLAEPLVTTTPLPRFDVSAMDGYAVSGDGPWRLRADVGYAGGVRPEPLAPGEAVRIATGAHVPDGATSVVRDEFVTAAGDRLDRIPGTPIRDDVRRTGEDWQAGTELAAAGTPVTPIVVSAAASAEVTELDIRGPVTARVLVTGDEIVRNGPLGIGQTRDALGPILPDLLAWCGIRTADAALLAGTGAGFDAVFADPGADLVVVVGATGRGAADRLRPALDRAGARIVVERVRCRPGGSQITAVLPDGRVVLGLPGNPFAAVATLLITVPAVVDALTGRRPQVGTGILANADAVSAPLTRIVPVSRTPHGEWVGSASTRTAHLAGMLGHDALAILRAGDVVVSARVRGSELPEPGDAVSLTEG